MNARLAIALAGVAVTLGLSACADSVTGPETRRAEPVAAAPIAPDSASANKLEDIQMALLSVLNEVKPCLNNGWTKYTTTAGKAFKNVLECAIYAALGGKLVPIPADNGPLPVLTSVNFDGCLGDAVNPNVTAVFTGGTGTLTALNLDGTTTPLGAITSGVPVLVAVTNVSAWRVTVTNAAGSVTGTASNIVGGGTAGCGSAGGGDFLKLAPGAKLPSVP